MSDSTGNFNGRALSLVRLHSPVHAPNVKGIGTGNTLDVNSTGAKDGLYLTKVEGGVYVQVTTTGIELFIPDGNIVNVVYAAQ